MEKRYYKIINVPIKSIILLYYSLLYINNSYAIQIFRKLLFTLNKI